MQDAFYLIRVRLDVWVLDPFQNKSPSNVESSRPHPLSTTQGIRMTYFSINKDRDNGGGLLAAAVASS